MTELEIYLMHELDNERQRNDSLIEIILNHCIPGATVAETGGDIAIPGDINAKPHGREPWWLKKKRLEKAFAAIPKVEDAKQELENVKQRVKKELETNSSLDG
jgi:hypothetical protein